MRIWIYNSAIATENYSATVRGGLLGGVTGLGVGGLAVFAASKRFAIIRHLTLPMQAFLVTSSGTFSGKLLLS